jgi:hypothetical protein
MIIISHRGNYFHKISAKENSPSYVQEVLDKGLYCEVDVYYTNRWYSGHDIPQYELTLEWMLKRKDKCIFHAKNLDALNKLLEYGFHCFSNDKDPFSITSHGYIWTNIGISLTPKSIAVLPEKCPDLYIGGCYGICTDSPVLYAKHDQLTESLKTKSVINTTQTSGYMDI